MNEFKNNNFHKAIFYFEKTLSKNANYKISNYNIAQAYKLLGNIESAVEHYLKEIKVNPEYSFSYY